MSNDKQRVGQFLKEHNTVTIATIHEAEPWASAVFYVNDEWLNLYFKTDPATRRGEDITKNASVAATIQEDSQNWTQIRGVQMSGTCTLVPDDEVARIEGLYLEKFDFLKRLDDRAIDPSERVLVERLSSTPYYRLRPHWIRLIDNRQGFGHKIEIDLAVKTP